jgi:TonB-linked SusC/RagA family outer membrane protein
VAPFQSLAVVSVHLVRSGCPSFTDELGQFNLLLGPLPDTLVASLTGYQTQRIPVNNLVPLHLSLTPLNNTLTEVVINTGYQQLPKERSAGSFTAINNELLNRRAGANILDRLDGVASGLIFNRNKTPAANESGILIRGRSTLFANPEPLVIVDNFPYQGDINSINPSDVETITLLKDATASSIWGVRAGNGVIVITTKKGSLEKKASVQVSANLTIGDKPDLFYLSAINTNDYLGLESYLFGKGYYNFRINTPFMSLPAGIDLLAQQKAGLLSPEETAARLKQLTSQDIRHDLNHYFYQPSVSQQYSVSLSGSTVSNTYYFSTGYDQTAGPVKGSYQNRMTIRGLNIYQLLPGKLSLQSEFNLSATNAHSPSNAYSQSYPIYTSLVDGSGRALPVYPDYRKQWLDTIGQGQLLNWTLKPLDERDLVNNHTTGMEYRLTQQLKFRISKEADVNLYYQFQKGSTVNDNLQSQDSYYTRDLINRYSQPDYVVKTPNRAIPLGDILDKTRIDYRSHQARIQANYKKQFNSNHRLDVLMGAEISDYKSFTESSRKYGYNRDNATDIMVNLITPVFTLPYGFTSVIPSTNGQKGITDRYLSYFSNIGYQFKDRYLVNASARKDASNLFGVNANQRAVPLWSIGAGWVASKESFFKSKIIDYLKLRLTYGYSGNVDKSTTAKTTAGVYYTSFFQQPTDYLVNPPNPDLSWEKISTLNAGVDFSIRKDLLTGSLDVFVKEGRDLVGNSPVASQTGLSLFRQNVADMCTKGLDLVLNAHPVKGTWDWTISLLYSYTADEITRYLVKPAQANYVVAAISTNPVQGKPWSAVFAYPWAGLSGQTGDPQGFTGGQISTNYNRLINPLSIDELIYKGPGRPTSFGGLRQELGWRRFRLSVNLTYEMGYYFRKNSIHYTNLFAATASAGTLVNADYNLRWQKPGDEATTNVPSMVYPAVYARDEFYRYSDPLIEKGDHIRLKDIRLSYDWLFQHQRSKAEFYAYASNLGILWRANKAGMDPNYVNGYPAPASYTIGVNLKF